MNILGWIIAIALIGIVFAIVDNRKPNTPKVQTFSHYEDYVIGDDGIINMIKHIDIRV